MTYYDRYRNYIIILKAHISGNQAVVPQLGTRRATRPPK